MRVGHGFDAHQFASDIPLYLGGIKIPHSHGLVGDSDGDAVIHALCDALLGALALGTLGEYFPKAAAEKNRDSKHYLKQIYSLIKEKGYWLSNADITIVAQQPRLSPHIPVMRQTLAEILKTGIEHISIKATTTDHMGYIGRCEGLAAHVVVLVSR